MGALKGVTNAKGDGPLESSVKKNVPLESTVVVLEPIKPKEEAGKEDTERRLGTGAGNRSPRKKRLLNDRARKTLIVLIYISFSFISAFMIFMLVDHNHFKWATSPTDLAPKLSPHNLGHSRPAKPWNIQDIYVEGEKDAGHLSNSSCVYSRKYWRCDHYAFVVHDLSSQWSAVVDLERKECFISPSFSLKKCLEVYPSELDLQLGVVNRESKALRNIAASSRLISCQPVTSLGHTGATIQRWCSQKITHLILGVRFRYHQGRFRWRISKRSASDHLHHKEVEWQPMEPVGKPWASRLSNN